MRKNRHLKTCKGDFRLREMITKEAAKLMYEGHSNQYHTAKWRAAKSVLSRGDKRVKNIRTHDLPSNGEISEAVYALAKFNEGDSISVRLFAMRIAALDIMEKLDEFSPRLIGSVSTGCIKKSSDIDIHIFTDSIEMLEHKLQELNWHFEREQTHILYNGKPREFTHIYIEQEFPVELSVYPSNEIRVQGRSSTDGKPIVRFSYTKLLALIQGEHNEQWQAHIDNQEHGL